MCVFIIETEGVANTLLQPVLDNASVVSLDLKIDATRGDAVCVVQIAHMKHVYVVWLAGFGMEEGKFIIFVRTWGYFTLFYQPGSMPPDSAPDFGIPWDSQGGL